MAKLTAAQRKALPKSTFGEPGKRAYPMPDRNHAQFAEAMATKEERKGKLSPAAANRIRVKANALLARGK